MKAFAVALMVSAAVFVGPAAAADAIHVSDSRGRLGLVEISSGKVSLIGDMGTVMTDIGFHPAGSLFAIDFTHLFAVDAKTARTVVIGPHGIPCGNALVFAADGKAYAAGCESDALFQIDVATGQAKRLGKIGSASSGDLAFHQGALYFTTPGAGGDRLLRISLNPCCAGTTVGETRTPVVYGLATDSTRMLRAVAGTRLYNVNTVNGTLTGIADFAGQGLVDAYGASIDPTALLTQ